MQARAPLVQPGGRAPCRGYRCHPRRLHTAAAPFDKTDYDAERLKLDEQARTAMRAALQRDTTAEALQPGTVAGAWKWVSTLPCKMI
jgi:hypothetical protein